MARPVNAQVVVITGASSGIGRAAAVALGRRGATVVLAARNERALTTAAAEVEAAGGRAHIIPTDVAEWPQVERLAREAVERCGRIDTWVNDAAVAAYATFDQTTPEEMEQIIRINLLGQMYGTKAALAQMRRQGEGGIINLGSIESKRAMPYHSAYAASKHGVKGFSEALRLELAHEQSAISVTLIMPAAINTPFFDHSRSKLGVKPLAFPPSYAPEIVAEAIVYAAEHPRREIVVGGMGKVLLTQQRLAPGLLDRLLLLGGLGFRLQRTDQPDDGQDNLFAPLDEPGAVHGEFAATTFPHSAYTRLFELHPALRRGAAAAAAMGALALLRRAGR